MIRFLKERNRTLLELWMGMAAFGIICEIFIIVFSKRIGIHSASLWIGVLMAEASSLHMNHSLERALGFDENTAKKKITASYVIRYLVIVIVFAVICVTSFFNPLFTFLGYMTLKAGALIQPFTHKLCNRIFHETDPVPMTEEEWQKQNN
jgi:hypothetical protein